VTLDPSTLLAFRDAIDAASERFRDRPDDLDRLEAFDALVTMVREANLTVDLRRAQNRYYRMRHSVRPAIEAAGNGHATLTWLELFDSLGAKLSIAAE